VADIDDEILLTVNREYEDDKSFEATYPYEKRKIN